MLEKLAKVIFDSGYKQIGLKFTQKTNEDSSVNLHSLGINN